MAWAEYEESKWEERDKLTHYLAAILAEIRRSWVDNKNGVQPQYLAFDKKENPAELRSKGGEGAERERVLDVLGKGAWMGSVNPKLIEHRRISRAELRAMEGDSLEGEEG